MKRFRSCFVKRGLIVVLFLISGAFIAHSQSEVGVGGKIDVAYGFDITGNFDVVSVNLMPSYHINKSWAAGMGIGYQNVNLFDDNLSLFPLFIHGQWNIKPNSMIVPFIGLRGGFAVGSKIVKEGRLRGIKMSGGFMGSLEVGFKIKVLNSAILISTFFENVQIRQVTNISRNTYNKTIGARLGFEF